MRRHDVSHLPVVGKRGGVVGIVARGDLLGECIREDKLIREGVLSEVLANRLDDPDAVEAGVERGVVTLEGRVRFASDALYAVEASRRIPGVVDVVDLLRRGTDDRVPQVGPAF
jgi:CBS domain-containing protein